MKNFLIGCFVIILILHLLLWSTIITHYGIPKIFQKICKSYIWFCIASEILVLIPIVNIMYAVLIVGNAYDGEW